MQNVLKFHIKEEKIYYYLGLCLSYLYIRYPACKQNECRFITNMSDKNYFMSPYS